MSVLIDSSGWIEYFGDKPKAKYFVSWIEKATPENTLTPSIVIFEVFKKVKKDFDEQKANQAIAYIESNTTIISLDKTIALHAANISSEKKLSLADAVIKATAELHNAELKTMDKHFKGMEKAEVF